MAIIDSLTPEKGKDGHTGVVHGTGFKGNNPTVAFGSKSADAISLTSDQVIKFKVPTTTAADRIASDPSKSLVSVTVGAASRSFVFQYDPPGDQPTISSFDPNNVGAAQTVATTILGANFTNNAGRTPDSVFLAEAGITGDIVPATAGADRVSVTFSSNDGRSDIPAASYTVVLGFNDGSAASGQFTIS